MPDITILKEATDNGLAVMLSELIRQNLTQTPEKINVFNSLDARIRIDARDIRITVGLEFKNGSLSIRGNSMMKPDLHIVADSITILDLCLLKIKFGLPYFFDANGFKILRKLITGQVTIKGILRHLSTLVKLTKLISVIVGRNEFTQGQDVRVLIL
jgi:hypothetical protein